MTVVKLHGDYADLDKRNTVDELATYPPAQEELLGRVLDEYGLVVCGWSGDGDAALLRAIEATTDRRYPLFWSSYAQPACDASRVIATRGAVSIPHMSADDLFTGLKARVDALGRHLARGGGPVARQDR